MFHRLLTLDRPSRPSSTHDPFDQLFRSFFPEFAPVPAFPQLNVENGADVIKVMAAVPGVAPDSIDVELERGVLTISGRRDTQATEDSARTIRRERQTGTFRRQVRLNTPVDADKVEARFENGVLTVTLPKAAESRPRSIQVNAS